MSSHVLCVPGSAPSCHTLSAHFLPPPFSPWFLSSWTPTLTLQIPQTPRIYLPLLPTSSSPSAVNSPVGAYYATGFKPVRLLADPQFVRAWPGGMGDTKCGGNYAPTIMPQLHAAGQANAMRPATPVLTLCKLLHLRALCCDVTTCVLVHLHSSGAIVASQQSAVASRCSGSLMTMRRSLRLAR